MRGIRPDRGLAAAAAAVVAALALAIATPPALGPAAAAADPSTAPQPRPRDRLSVPVGNRSCSARACHGGLSASGGPIGQNEYTVWLTRDRHAEAYDVLVSNPLSKSIVQKLADRPATARPAFEDTRCLACHANPGAAVEEPVVALRQEGVNCEACHGAGPWVNEHTNSRAWRALKPEVRASRGLVPTRSLASRAHVCVGCHVGAAADPAVASPVRDVNHDLIAAGHPRLAFELAAYLDAMPAHWNPATHAGEQDLQGRVRTWAVGQAEGALSALRLLEDRAGKKTRPWPELAEYDCLACHHDLRAPGWRQNGRRGGRAPGALAWGTWSFSLLPQAMKTISPSPAASVAEPLAALDSLRQRLSQPIPDRARVRTQAGAAAEALAAWPRSLESATFEPDSIASLVNSVVSEAASGDDPTWARATQAYLAAAALYPALVKQDTRYRDSRVEAFLESGQKSLAFPPAEDSPSGSALPLERAEPSAPGAGASRTGPAR